MYLFFCKILGRDPKPRMYRWCRIRNYHYRLKWWFDCSSMTSPVRFVLRVTHKFTQRISRHYSKFRFQLRWNRKMRKEQKVLRTFIPSSLAETVKMTLARKRIKELGGNGWRVAVNITLLESWNLDYPGCQISILEENEELGKIGVSYLSLRHLGLGYLQ